jgi:hypothetical protein
LTKFWGAGFVEESQLLQLAERCPCLEDLSDGGVTFTSSGMIALWSRLQNLKKVTLHCQQPSEESLLALVRNNPGLQVLRVCGLGITDEFLRALAHSCLDLTELCLACANVVSSYLEEVWFCCPKLQSVRIEQCNILCLPVETVSESLVEFTLDGCHIDDQGLEELLGSFPALTTLEIRECEVLQKLHDLPLGWLCPNLRSVRIYENGSAAGDGMLHSLSAHCGNLRLLVIPDAKPATDAGLCAVARCCGLLETLDIANCVKATDMLLHTIADYNYELKVLSLQGCKKMTTKGVKAVMAGCPKLSKFCVDGCTRLSAAVKRTIEERYTNDGDY